MLFVEMLFSKNARMATEINEDYGAEVKVLQHFVVTNLSLRTVFSEVWPIEKSLENGSPDETQHTTRGSPVENSFLRKCVLSAFV